MPLDTSFEKSYPTMDQNRIKQLKTQRGFTYSYYFSASVGNKPTLFLSHGFPTPAYVWAKQIAFFEPMGYGIIAPDLLGYGGTDKPTDPRFYVGSGHAQDAIDILDHENIDKVITVSHDWGSRVVSRIVNYYPKRLIACAFLAVGYGPPNTMYADPLTMSAMITEMVGYDVLAYQQFFIEPETPKLFEKNFDSFFSLLFPVAPEIWKDNMCVVDGAKTWIKENKTTALPPHISSEDKEFYRKSLISGGMTAPLCWYRVVGEQCNQEDDAKISPELYNINQPVLFVAFSKDVIGLARFGDETHPKFVKGPYTRKEIDGDHWAPVTSHSSELNKILLEWVEGLSV
ncbi:alpha/beta-hydrolase [Mycena polygramma]|nr:alpha/beta-hydrolase [Mycena polygramma]KAJ7982833.1 alpha/beta-hydrolase [Mycena polygramma]